MSWPDARLCTVHGFCHLSARRCCEKCRTCMNILFTGLFAGVSRWLFSVCICRIKKGKQTYNRDALCNSGGTRMCVRALRCPVRPHLILRGRLRRSSSPRYAGTIAESGHIQAMPVDQNSLDGDGEWMCCQSNGTMSGFNSAGNNSLEDSIKSFHRDDRNIMIGPGGLQC